MKLFEFETSCWPHGYAFGLCATSLRSCIREGLKVKDLELPCLRMEGGCQLAWSDLGPLATSAFTFFDPNDPACQEILFDPQTTIPELFAIVRQWVPQVQHKIDVIGNEVKTTGEAREGEVGSLTSLVSLPGSLILLDSASRLSCE